MQLDFASQLAIAVPTDIAVLQTAGFLMEDYIRI